MACPSAFLSTIAFSSSVAINPGTYFLAMSCDNTAASFYFSTTVPYVMGPTTVGSSHPAPSSVTISGLGGVVPVMALLAS